MMRLLIRMDMATTYATFFYYSGSANAAPGYGTGETITPEQIVLYRPLTLHYNWRKTLSNFYLARMVIDDLEWASVEHYYQASKFKQMNPEFYKKFSIPFGPTQYATDPIVAKAAGGKSGKKRGELLRPLTTTIDPGFFDGTFPRSNAEMYIAMFAKFSQNEDLKTILLLTRDAILTHGTRGVPTTVQHELMRVRAELMSI